MHLSPNNTNSINKQFVWLQISEYGSQEYLRNVSAFDSELKGPFTNTGAEPSLPTFGLLFPLLSECVPSLRL